MSEALMQNALALRRAGRLAEAAQLYDEVLRAAPAHFGALHALGILRYQSGQLEEAERLIGRAIEVNPSAADALYNRGSLLLRLERGEEAIAAFSRAIALEPDYVEALTNRGNALVRLERHGPAAEDFARAVALRPNLAELWISLGAAQMKSKRPGEAAASFDKGLAVKPEMFEAWVLRGNALALTGALEEAAASYTKALQLRPGDGEALFGRADALLLMRRFEDSARDYRQLLGNEPRRNYALGNLVFCKLQMCDWEGLEEDLAALRSGMLSGAALAAPFPSLAAGWAESQAELLAPARAWSKEQFPPALTPLWNGERYGHEKIRIAYLSANFNEHPAARLLAGVLEQHDKSRFQTIGISFGEDDASPLRARVMSACDRFIDVRAKSDAEVAALLRQSEVDIAVDLMGFTDRCRPGILALRPAPVQVNWLGFAGTLGTSAIDYLIGDPTVTPETDDGGFAEQVVRLPDCYLPADEKRVIGVAPSRTAAGLPEAGFVFCCFNNGYKYSPQVFDIWMRLLREVVGSVLWLSNPAPAAARNLAREAQARGIDAGRVIFAPYLARDEDHLARVSLADLFLDTLPYNAHATASDALWAGVPVLTCRGPTFAGRVAASLTCAAGLPELAVSSLGEYEAMALKLARDPATLLGVKEKLKANRHPHPLFDTRRFTHNLEMAFTAMWQKSRKGEAPAGFTMADGAAP